MTNYLVFSEGFVFACGSLMACIAIFMWQHHKTRPTWGLRWLSTAMALGAVSNLMSPILITNAWRTLIQQPDLGMSSLIAMMIGFGSMSALVVGMLFYVRQSVQSPWHIFWGIWFGAQIVVLVFAGVFKILFVGDIIAACIFFLGSLLSFAAMRKEPRGGHGVLGLIFLAHPLTFSLLATLDIDLRAVRYLSALPYVTVGLTLLSASLVRIRSELDRELAAGIEVQKHLQASQEALKKSHDVQQALLSEAPVPMSYTPVIDGTFPRSYWNRAWYRTFGYSPASKEGINGADFDLYVEPVTRENYLRTVLTEHSVGPLEARLRDAFGAEKLCQMYGSLIDSDDGQFVVTSYVDITTQRANELHLRQFEIMVQNADDAMLVIVNGLILFANNSAARMFGQSTKALIGQSPVTFSPSIQPDGRSSHEAARTYFNDASFGVPQRFYWQHLRVNGKEFTAQVSLTLVASTHQQFVAILRDVTEDQAKSDALAMNEARIKSIIAVSNTGAWEFHGETGYLWCSPEYFTMLGYDPENFVMNGQANLSETWIQLLHPEDEARSASVFAEYLKAGSIGMYENQFRMRHRDGHWIWILSRGQTLRDANGQLTDLTVGTHINISDQKLIEDQLSRARYLAEAIAKAQLQFILQSQRRSAFEGLLLDILSLTDSEYGFIGEVLYNRQGQPYLKTFSITNIAWDKASEDFYLTHAPKGLEFTNLSTLFGHVMKTGKAIISNAPYEDQRRGGLPDGHPALNAFLGVPVYHGEELVGMFGVSNRPGGYSEHLIEYLKPLILTIGHLINAIRTEQKQKETELRFQSISNNLPNSMVYQLDCGEDGSERRFTYLSASIESLHGLNYAEVLNDARLLYNQIHPEDLVMLQRKEEECISAMSEFTTEYRGSGPNGDERWFYVSSTPSRNQNNHIIWDGIEIDITERKHAEQQLRVLNANLETRVIERTSELSDALENLKLTQQELIQSEKLAALGALVAGVAHELNTPIGNAVTVSSTLVEAHNELLSKMESGLTRSMLNEFLSTVSEAGAMLTHNLVRAADLVHSFKQVAVDQNNHQRRRFVLEEILNEVRIIMTPALRKSHVTLQIEAAPKFSLDSYPGALTQALMILINNAIVHAFEGRDSGVVCIVATSTDAERVKIQVMDNGIGIPATSLKRIFEPFYTTKIGKGGSGLGLHICFNVVTATLGGKIYAESDVGVGTTVTIDIPIESPRMTDLAVATETP